MSVGAISAVGDTGAASAAQSPASARKPADSGNSISMPQGNQSQSSGAGMTSACNNNMSTSDFVTLTQKVANGNKSGGITDTMDMIKMVVALQILQKTLEATSKIIDSFMGTGEAS